MACWRIDGTIQVHGYKIPVHQKFNHGQSYSFMKGPYIVHVQVKSEIHYEVVKKENITLTQVSKGVFPIENSEARYKDDRLNFAFKLEHI